jgi:carbamoyltransferase
MKERLNARVKRREGFRPFAPAVPLERCAEFFTLPNGVPSPYMMLIGDVRAEQRSRLPAVTHADGTARVQTVTREENPLFHELLEEFSRLKGVPVLLNTSFNENEPIVCRPDEALACFARAGLEALSIGDFLVEKP